MLAGTVSFVSGNTMRGAAVQVRNRYKTNIGGREAAAPMAPLKASQGAVGTKGPKYWTVFSFIFFVMLGRRYLFIIF